MLHSAVQCTMPQPNLVLTFSVSKNVKKSLIGCYSFYYSCSLFMNKAHHNYYIQLFYIMQLIINYTTEDRKKQKLQQVGVEQG